MVPHINKPEDEHAHHSSYDHPQIRRGGNMLKARKQHVSIHIPEDLEIASEPTRLGSERASGLPCPCTPPYYRAQNWYVGQIPLYP